MEMKDVLKRLAELDSNNPNRPEYKIKTEQVIPSRPGTMPKPSGSGNVLPQNTEKIGQQIEFLRMRIKSDEDEIKQHIDNYPDLSPASSSHANFLRNRIAQNQARLQKLETVYQKKATPMLPGTQTKYNLENSNINECGTNYGSSMMSRPSTPASINITASSGSELSSMLKDIMSLAGMSKHDSEPEPISTPVSVVEPEMGDDSTSVMRSVIDKLNPKMDEVENEGLMGGLTGAGIGLAVGKTPSAGVMGYKLGSDVQDAFSDVGNDSDESDDSDDDDLKEYSNTPLDATEVPSFSKDAMVDKSRHNQDPAGHPQKGKRMNGTMPRAHVDDMYENLMRAYRNFVSETSK